MSSHEQRREEDRSIGYVRKNWPLIVALVTAISTGALTIDKVKDVSEAIKDHEKRLNQQDLAIQAIVPMKEDVNDLKDDVREIQRDIKTLLREFRGR